MAMTRQLEVRVEVTKQFTATIKSIKCNYQATVIKDDLVVLKKTLNNFYLNDGWSLVSIDET